MTSKKFDKPENWQFDYFKSRDGSRIRYGFAFPENGDNRGTVVLTGGYGRHIEYYYESINNWLDRGYAVWAMDWDGQGGSYCGCKNEPRKPSHKSFDAHVEDFHLFVRNIVRPDPAKPAFLSSHSKGGNIMLRYLRKYEKSDGFPFSGAVLGTPMLKLRSYILPGSLFNGIIRVFDEAGLSDMRLPAKVGLLQQFRERSIHKQPDKQSDIERLRDQFMKAQQTMHYNIGTPTIGWFAKATRSASEVMDESFLRAIDTPVLILTSRYDPLVTAKAQNIAASLLPNGEQEVFRAQHGIWYDRDEVQDALWRRIDDFIIRQACKFTAARQWWAGKTYPVDGPRA